jgi:hypothetical protein
MGGVDKRFGASSRGPGRLIPVNFAPPSRFFASKAAYQVGPVSRSSLQEKHIRRFSILQQNAAMFLVSVQVSPPACRRLGVLRRDKRLARVFGAAVNRGEAGRP